MMRSLIPLLLVMLAVLTATVFFQKKNAQAFTELDEIRSSLATLRGAMPKGSLVGCISKAAQPEAVFWVANALAPVVYVVPNAQARDTVLFVFDSNASDSLVSAAVQDNDVFWKERSPRFYFLLTSKTR